MRKKNNRVLVVDDQPGIRLTLKGVLRRKGYEVEEATTGEDAIKTVKKQDFDVVFMDNKMAGISGIDAMIEIKRIRPQTHVIMMTAYAVEEDVKKAIHEGAHSVVYKPFDMDKLLGIMKECLENRFLVLIVDDRVEDRVFVKTILKDQNIEVLEARNGLEGLQHLRERSVKVVCLDVRMPGMNGIAALKEIKELRPDVKPILISGFDTKEWIEQAKANGAVACLKKPVSQETLLAAIKKCLSK